MIVDRGQLAAALPNYELNDQLGAGYFGLVLAGRHRHLGRDVAIKVLAATDKGADDRFTAEARLLARMDHPHIVRVYDYVEYDGLRLIVMELLSGGSLSRRMAGIPPRSACAVGIAIAEALSYAHAQGVLHRDIKPDNVLFDATDLVKVTDFGIAKIFDGSAATASAVAGTPAYMAPEQIIGGRLGPATDIYALGVVLYQMLAGMPPFDPRLPLLKRHEQQLNTTPPALPGIPPVVADVVMHALASDVRVRPPSAQAFAVELTAAVRQAYGQNLVPDQGAKPKKSTPSDRNLHLLSNHAVRTHTLGPIDSASDRSHQPEAVSVAHGNNGAPKVEGLPTPRNISTSGEVASVAALVGWVALATLPAYFSKQHWWFGVAAVSGFLSLLAVRHDPDHAFLTAFPFWITLGLYIIIASNYTDNWQVRGFIIGIMILFALIAIGRYGRMISVWSIKRKQLESRR